jgi:hypothetical protein
LVFTGAPGIGRAALTGDVTAAAGSNTTAIAAGVIVDADVNASAAIAFTKLATIATDSLLGRDTASTGTLETIGLNATLSMTGSGSLQRAALTGDVTASAGSNTTAIAAGVIVDADVNASAAIAVTKLANGTACSVLGRSANSSGAYADISIGTNDHVLMRTSNVVTSGLIANANVDAAAAIAGTKISPNFGAQDVVTTGTYSSGSNPATTGNVRIVNNGSVRFRNNANSSDIIALNVSTGDAVSLGDSSALAVVLSSSTVLLRPAGTDRFALTDTVAEYRLSTVQFDTAVTSPVLNQETDSTASVTGDTFTINAQDCSGTTSVTAGAMAIRGGNATGASGTRNGGGLTLASGTGATSDGNVTINRGSTAVFSATSTATAVGNSTILVEGASISGRKFVSLARGSALSATQVPTNTGDGVLYLSACTTAPTANPVGGQLLWVDSSGNLWARGPSGSVTMLNPA